MGPSSFCLFWAFQQFFSDSLACLLNRILIQPVLSLIYVFLFFYPAVFFFCHHHCQDWKYWEICGERGCVVQDCIFCVCDLVIVDASKILICFFYCCDALSTMNVHDHSEKSFLIFYYVEVVILVAELFA